MPVHLKPQCDCYFVVVPGSFQTRSFPSRWCAGLPWLSRGKVAPGSEPAVISTSEGVQSLKLQHRAHLQRHRLVRVHHSVLVQHSIL
jgi:hypothetical protein